MALGLPTHGMRTLLVILPAIDERGPCEIKLRISSNATEVACYEATRREARRVGYPWTADAWDKAFAIVEDDE
jgi:hypothetical protein